MLSTCYLILGGVYVFQNSIIHLVYALFLKNHCNYTVIHLIVIFLGIRLNYFSLILFTYYVTSLVSFLIFEF